MTTKATSNQFRMKLLVGFVTKRNMEESSMHEWKHVERYHKSMFSLTTIYLSNCSKKKTKTIFISSYSVNYMYMYLWTLQGQTEDLLPCMGLTYCHKCESQVFALFYFPAFANIPLLEDICLSQNAIFAIFRCFKFTTDFVLNKDFSHACDQ